MADALKPPWLLTMFKQHIQDKHPRDSILMKVRACQILGIRKLPIPEEGYVYFDMSDGANQCVAKCKVGLLKQIEEEHEAISSAFLPLVHLHEYSLEMAAQIEDLPNEPRRLPVVHVKHLIYYAAQDQWLGNPGSLKLAVDTSATASPQRPRGGAAPSTSRTSGLKVKPASKPAGSKTAVNSSEKGKRVLPVPTELPSNDGNLFGRIRPNWDRMVKKKMKITEELCNIPSNDKFVLDFAGFGIDWDDDRTSQLLPAAPISPVEEARVVSDVTSAILLSSPPKQAIQQASQRSEAREPDWEAVDSDASDDHDTDDHDTEEEAVEWPPSDEEGVAGEEDITDDGRVSQRAVPESEGHQVEGSETGEHGDDMEDEEDTAADDEPDIENGHAEPASVKESSYSPAAAPSRSPHSAAKRRPSMLGSPPPQILVPASDTSQSRSQNNPPADSQPHSESHTSGTRSSRQAMPIPQLPTSSPELPRSRTEPASQQRSRNGRHSLQQSQRQAVSDDPFIADQASHVRQELDPDQMDVEKQDDRMSTKSSDSPKPSSRYALATQVIHESQRLPILGIPCQGPNVRKRARTSFETADKAEQRLNNDIYRSPDVPVHKKQRHSSAAQSTSVNNNEPWRNGAAYPETPSMDRRSDGQSPASSSSMRRHDSVRSSSNMARSRNSIPGELPHWAKPVASSSPAPGSHDPKTWAAPSFRAETSKNSVRGSHEPTSSSDLGKEAKLLVPRERTPPQATAFPSGGPAPIRIKKEHVRTRGMGNRTGSRVSPSRSSGSEETRTVKEEILSQVLHERPAPITVPGVSAGAQDISATGYVIPARDRGSSSHPETGKHTDGNRAASKGPPTSEIDPAPMAPRVRRCEARMHSAVSRDKFEMPIKIAPSQISALQSAALQGVPRSEQSPLVGQAAKNEPLSQAVRLNPSASSSAPAPRTSMASAADAASRQTSLRQSKTEGNESDRRPRPSKAVKDVVVKKGKKQPHGGMYFVDFQPTVAVSAGPTVDAPAGLPVDSRALRTWADISQIVTSVREERGREG